MFVLPLYTGPVWHLAEAIQKARVEFLPCNKLLRDHAQKRDHRETAIQDFLILDFFQLFWILGQEAKRVITNISWLNAVFENSVRSIRRPVKRLRLDTASQNKECGPER